MNRSDLISRLCDLYPKLSRKEVDALVKSFFSGIVNNIAKGVRIEVRGFGCFSLKKRRTVLIRNPRDGVSVEDDRSRYVVYFRPGKRLKSQVDN